MDLQNALEVHLHTNVLLSFTAPHGFSWQSSVWLDIFVVCVIGLANTMDSGNQPTQYNVVIFSYFLH